jgi:hypothetical protein
MPGQILIALVGKMPNKLILEKKIIRITKEIP